MLNPLQLDTFCETGQKDALDAYLLTLGYNPTNPTVHGYQLNNLFNQIVGQLNFLKSKGLSVWEGDKAYVATVNEEDIVRYKNKVYVALLNSTAKTPDLEPTFWKVLLDTSATTLDSNSVIDNLLSNSVTSPLSANQGLVIKAILDNIDAVLLSNDLSLDTVQEIADFIKTNASTIATKITASNYASADGRTGGTLKAKIVGSVLTLRTDGVNA